MTTIRPFEAEDLFRFNNVNLDPLTETYGLPFYLQYLINCRSISKLPNIPMVRSWVILWVKQKEEVRIGTAMSPPYRSPRSFAAKVWPQPLWTIWKESLKTKTAILLIFLCERIIDYYSGEKDEDAFDMRKALSKDVHKISMIPLKNPVDCNELELD
uniref:Uncharacterized protein n=1 Tax=Ditylenchus dipsaci TaxID=166011 RepID=A0A915CPF9_9BILA